MALLEDFKKAASVETGTTSWPTLSDIEEADVERLLYWWRFLPSPGLQGGGTVKKCEWEDMIYEQSLILVTIKDSILEGVTK
jgi:hypothetical protein